MKKIFSLFAAAVIAFAFTSCGGGADTPEKVAEKFLQHIAKSEFKDAKGLATGDAVKTIETLESFASMSELGGEKPEKKDVKIEDMKCDTKDDVANCTYKQDGKAGNIELKKVDGAWKVSSFPKETSGGDDMNGDVNTNDTTATDDVTEEVTK
jgi:PBP1b-binding outer membrane lipoprotein LpoB